MPAKLSRWVALILPAIVLQHGMTPPTVHAAATISAPAVGIRVTVDPRGAYTISMRRQAWTFAGAIGKPVRNLVTARGTDRLGSYSAITFMYRAPQPVRDEIRVYNRLPVILFSQEYLAPDSRTTAFPVLHTYPRGMFHLSYGENFSIYNFRALSADSPWLYFDKHDNAFMLSPAGNFLVANTTQGPGGALVSGIDSAIGRVPRGFTQKTLLVVGQGINGVYDAWGQAITRLQGKIRPANDATVELKYLGYWTDAGATYYYNYERDRGYEGTLLAVRNSFKRLNLPLGYMQLDSWWYTKGQAATWQGSGFLRGGIYEYSAAPTLFPQGLAEFQRRVGLPLVVHARWIDASSPYRRMYRMSGNVITDPRYWQHTAAYLSNAGVVTYEQDWLGRFAHTARNLADPSAFLGNMAAALRARGINMQYCMPLPRDLLQSTQYGNLVTARVSFDHFTRSQWTNELYDSRLASSLGIWPWTDVFMSSETNNLLLSNLSAGIVGVGDRLGKLDAANLRKVMRGDGVLVKPDVAMVPTDDTYAADAAGIDRPMVAFTFTNHGAARSLYIFAYQRAAATQATVRPAALGLRGKAYVYNYFTGVGRVLSPGTAFNDTVHSASYYIAAPIGPSGMALLGDLGRFVSLGKARISQLNDTGRIQAGISFGKGERSVILSGYAPRRPVVNALKGGIGAVVYDRATHLFHASVSPASSGTAMLRISEPSR